MRHTTTLVAGLALISACHGHSEEGPQADEYLYDCESDAGAPGAMNYATDENFALFVNKEAANAVVKDDARAARLTSPAPGTTLSAATPPTFSFQVMAAAPAAPGARRWARACPRPSRWQRLWSAISFEGTAWAHCGAVSGDNYLLRVTDGGAAVYTALLSVTSFTPKAEVWSKALSGRAGHTVTVTVERATLLRGDITQGPFAPTNPPTFMVGP